MLPNKKSISYKWLFKIKIKADGSIERYKARLVAKGSIQKHGNDFHETFSSVFYMVTIRTIISLTASKIWKFFQLHITNAFLHGDLNEKICMKIPEGGSKSSQFCLSFKEKLV